MKTRQEEIDSSQGNSGSLDGGGGSWAAFLSTGGFSERSGGKRLRYFSKTERSTGRIKGWGIQGMFRSGEVLATEGAPSLAGCDLWSGT